ncbi:molybdopterin cofactor-binding domain-containing protein [Xanthobacter sp. V2C-8]|uniref:xanthine dehydrogenase family protein molybdopterin-binding subunit n=1 Tax=Xanthobacter albus TaxID=3119929 RepID=UPI0037275881
MTVPLGGGVLGQPVPRIEDTALLTGRGRYADDLPAPRGTLHAHVVRSPHAHARLLSIDTAAARAAEGVAAVFTGEDLRDITSPFMVVLKAPIDQWPLALEEVRFVGEPVALVLAESRYLAEDAAELVEVRYAPEPAVLTIAEALRDGAPLVHAAAGANVISTRDFTYGDPDGAFARCHRRVRIHSEYPRSSFTPMECFVVVAQYEPADDSFDIQANFQGPYTVHPVMARALRVPGNRLRVRTPPDSGGSFGIKLAIFPYMVLMAAAARRAGRPVKWVEDRNEHLVAANSGPNRLTEIEAAVAADGRVLALRFDQIEDYGAFLRAPMPGPLYRMHGATTGAYDIQNLFVRNRVVLTHRAPVGLVRGFGGPQLYLALERLMHRVAVELGLDPLDVIRRNLVPAGAFPYRTAAGALYDSGDYPRAVDETVGAGRLEDLLRRRAQARAEGRFYGIGFAAVVEPGMSNMGYLSNILPASVRERNGPKNGAVSLATVSIDPLGAVLVTADVTVQGQGHATVLSQVVADALGLSMDRIKVDLELDTRKDAWSIAAGTYSCRFSPGTAVAAHLAAMKLRRRLARTAAGLLNVDAAELEFADGRVFSRANPANGLDFARVAGTAHWAPALLPDGVPAALRETGVWNPEQLSAPSPDDRINTSLTYGFVFDMCGVEVDPVTFEARVDRYVSMHDAGRLLNPLIAEGQIRGAFVQGLATALYEEFVYDADGAFLTGTFADYVVPSAREVPALELLHIESPSPFTPLGAKGLAEGNCMSVPACVSNAIADALGLADVPLPATPRRLHAAMAPAEAGAPVAANPGAGVDADAPAAAGLGGRSLHGSGAVEVAAPPQAVWAALLDPETLRRAIPGCSALTATGPHAYAAEVALGVGPVRGRFSAQVELSDLDPPRSGRIGGALSGPLGTAAGGGRLVLTPTAEGTRIAYDFSVEVGGKVASVGGRMLDGAARIVIGQFFERLAGALAPADAARIGWLARLLRRLARRRRPS